jgi:hypothetical protein
LEGEKERKNTKKILVADPKEALILLYQKELTEEGDEEVGTNGLGQDSR